MKRARVFLMMALLAGLLLSACGGTATGTPAESSPPAHTQPAATITVVDALDRSVPFDQLPSRIVVAGKSSLTLIDTLFLFPEASDRIVGLVVGRQDPGDFLAHVDPAFARKAVLEVEAGPEQIAPLQPDVVVLRSFMAETLGRSLEQVGIPVIYLDLETPQQYSRDLITLGQLFGNETRAGEIHAYYQSRLDAVEKGLQGLTAEKKPRVLILQYSTQGGEVAVSVPSAAWIQTMEAEIAGAHPVWTEAAQGGGWTVVNFEQIAAWDPDKVFVIHYAGNASEIAARLRADPRWQALRAVQQGEIYGFAAEFYSWDQPDPRWILGVTWLAGKVHPDRFSGLDMLEEVSRFFGQMYGMEDASIREHIIPRLTGDVE
jgi:iron complex transport system substrate-binding protein